MPQCVYAVPSAPAAQARPGGLASAWLWSRASALALPHIAARTGASRQAAVLAAACALLARRTGHQRCVFPSPLNNRYENHLSGYVGNLAHDGLISIDAAAQGFDELVGRTAAATLRACWSSMIDRTDMLRIAATVEDDRGTAYSRDCSFNDLSSYSGQADDCAAADDPAQARHALGLSKLYWIDPAPLDELLLLDLMQVDGEMVLGAVTADSGRVPRHDIESLLRGVELLLVTAACGDVDLGRVGEITGVHPNSRGPGWLRIDSCWIELAEAQRLLDDALPGTAAHVFPVPGTGGDTTLTAYLAAVPAVSTPSRPTPHAWPCSPGTAGPGRPAAPATPR
jgi:hypothetical protein